MRKVAIFVEGQSEQIFIRNILYHIVENTILSFECIKIHGDCNSRAPYNWSSPNPKIHFLIINVENDDKVISAIKGREEELLNSGFDKIIGLRDMYSLKYRNRSNGTINASVNKLFIDSHNKIIQSMSSPDCISFHFSIMEVETWWLGMYSVIEKLHDNLNLTLIKESLGYELNLIDPENELFHPAKVLSNILELVDLTYSKKAAEVESITRQIEHDDIEKLVTSGKCSSFKLFHDCILEQIPT